MSLAFTLLFFFILALLGGVLWWVLKLFGLVSGPRWRKKFALERHENNPLLAPLPYHSWENEAVFNPAAVDIGGRVHLLYRAMGSDGISRIGYASSGDGIHFDERVSYPVYVPTREIGMPSLGTHTMPQRYDRSLYPSGGGWGGTEDPRAVVIDSVVYMTFVAFDGWGFVRMALASIEADDIIKKCWKWSMPKLLSPPNQVHKNWVLFPEKIHGKFAFIHSLAPTLDIQYVDDLSTFDGNTFLKSDYGRTYRPGVWDSWVRGAGPPPLKTKDGWLLLYHAIDEREPHKYKLGAMLLDLLDPSIILHRSQEPILTPEAWYENQGKSGVVYACGAVIQNDTLYVYYGGGDTSINVAHAPLSTVLDELKKDTAAHLTSEKITL